LIEKIRKFKIQKAGYISIVVGIFAISVHIFVMSHVMPYTWINGGRSISYQAASKTSLSSIITIFISILITLIASKIIPLRLNKFWTIVLIIWLWLGIPLDIIGIAQQFLGTIFEKSCMSIVTIIGFMMDFRIALEKRL
jgi:predicted neutral ceramidase superfamily lipid hydrolase